MKRLMIAGLALALCACATTGPNGEPRMSEAEQIRLGCSGAQLTVAVIDASAAEPEWNLTDAQLRAFLAARKSVMEICETPPLTFEELKAEGYADALELLTNELAGYLARKNGTP